MGEPNLVDAGEFENKAIPITPKKISKPGKKFPKTNDQNLLWMKILGVTILVFIGVVVCLRKTTTLNGYKK